MAVAEDEPVGSADSGAVGTKKAAPDAAPLVSADSGVTGEQKAAPEADAEPAVPAEAASAPPKVKARKN